MALLRKFTLQAFMLPVFIMALVMIVAVTAALAADDAGRGEVFLENAWVRAMPPSQHNTAGYLTLRNNTDNTLHVTGANSVPVARVEMHISRQVNGMMKMERLEVIEVAPGASIEFSPAGMHLMIMGLDKMPVPGEQLTLCLEIETLAPVCAVAPVRKVALSADDSMHNHKHH